MKTLNKLMIAALAFPCMGIGAGLFTSCSDVQSTLVEYAEDNELDDPNDTVYSLLGIMSKMQYLADRTILLGELRGDLVVPTDHATTDIYDLAMFQASTDNAYNKPSDYYAVIQNCNYYLAHVDADLAKRGQKVFEREIAAVHTFRAWTYLQLAINYGEIPFFTEPILKEKDADPNLYPKYGVQKVCDLLIEDMKPYIDAKYPLIGNGFGKDRFIYPRLLLADLNLWAGHYEEAAQLYFDFLNDQGRSDYHAFGNSRHTWSSYEFDGTSGGLSTTKLTTIAMDTVEFSGVVTHLRDVFNSTTNNSYYYQVTPSTALNQLSQAQHYTFTYRNPTTLIEDTISPPDTITYEPANLRGDLRLNAKYEVGPNNTSNDTYSKIRQTISSPAMESLAVNIYTVQQVYLRYVEALNLAGYPWEAFVALKYGLYETTINKHITADQQARSLHLINFNQYNFTSENTMGIHSRGCGDVWADTTYIIPECPTRQDSIDYVENLLIDEMALETDFEGVRFGDLLRYALRHDDTEWFAKKVASRSGSLDLVLYDRIKVRKNWFLPLP